MRLLSRVVLLLVLSSGVAYQTVASPPSQAAHGVPDATFQTLWSGDVDHPIDRKTIDGDLAALAATTDIPFDEPPVAVEQWNRGDVQEFPSTSVEKSIHPRAVSLHDGRYIKDAYTAIFAVTPSTRTRVRPDWQPLQVAPSGDVHGTTDYRVAVPDDDTTGDRRVYWSLADHGIVETRLLVNGDVEARAAGSHTPTVAFSDLAAYRGSEQTLTLATTVEVELEKRILVEQVHCETVSVAPTTANQSTTDDTTTANVTQKRVQRCWTSVGERIEHSQETITVRDEIDVLAYDFSISGYRARYPNGDLGLEVHTNRPWRSYALPGADIRGAWRFYTVRDPRWDQLTVSTETESTVRESPLQPLQVTAYPIAGGPTATPYGTVTFLDIYGAVVPAPSLPTQIDLDSQSGPYTASYGIATRSETQSAPTVQAFGLVRGTSERLTVTEFTSVPINRSSLRMTVLNSTSETITVRLQLRDAGSGAPINTWIDGGFVVLAGDRYETSSMGTVTATLARSDETIHARYEPGQWWEYRQGYTGSTDTIHTNSTVLQFVQTLFELAIPTLSFVFAGLLIDRFTGWSLWPPWRGL